MPLLIAFARHDPGDPQVWLLLAWTAPSRGAAIAYFKRMQRLALNSALAQDGLLWSRHEWSPLRHPAAPITASPDPCRLSHNLSILKE